MTTNDDIHRYDGVPLIDNAYYYIDSSGVFQLVEGYIPDLDSNYVGCVSKIDNDCWEVVIWTQNMDVVERFEVDDTRQDGRLLATKDETVLPRTEGALEAVRQGELSDGGDN